jgi:hypothetical protein
MDGSRILGMQQQGCRFPEKARGKGRLNARTKQILLYRQFTQHLEPGDTLDESRFDALAVRTLLNSR